LLKLILRVIEPDFGTIFVNGSFDVRMIKISSLRKGIVFVPQEAFIFSGSIRDNIAFMNQDITDEEIVEAARIAQIYDDVMGFKDGFDTLIGERGLTISGGQRQRLALARALVMNPRVLVLDDVLSSLDLKTESEVLRNLRRTMRGRTLIVVSSRVPSISGFDRIAVLDEGRVVELGSHEELIERDGIYASLYSVQAAA
ncbi:MAG: ATP-binding cassette domain-containing protein, partial [Candidatus Caldarchaeum sp.]